VGVAVAAVAAGQRSAKLRSRLQVSTAAAGPGRRRRGPNRSLLLGLPVAANRKTDWLPCSRGSNILPGATRHGWTDPRVTREGLSAIPLGHRTYLAAKAKGESSMFEKAGHRETVYRCAGRDPDGMVKVALLEPQFPKRKLSSWIQRETSTVPGKPQSYYHCGQKRRGLDTRLLRTPRGQDRL
jgi:hypothetical protein